MWYLEIMGEIMYSVGYVCGEGGGNLYAVTVVVFDGWSIVETLLCVQIP